MDSAAAAPFGLSSSSQSRHHVSSASMASGPTIVVPREFPVPSYLKQSAFYDRFTVGHGLLNVAPSTSASAMLHSSSTSSSASIKGKRRDDYQGSGQLSSASGSATRSTLNSINRIPLPSRLDPEQCCRRLLITQDYGLQFLPERDEQGRESERWQRASPGVQCNPCCRSPYVCHYLALTLIAVLRPSELNTRDPDKVGCEDPPIEAGDLVDLQTDRSMSDTGRSVCSGRLSDPASDRRVLL